ncbi:MFS transporter [Aggregicoccus sp. 17bor-14]|nr:MFS transporter [Simulacricoccus sp. 17bor-14]MRI87775.1 MFS transporter [Aggregicoccus sp. 17bor-14]
MDAHAAVPHDARSIPALAVPLLSLAAFGSSLSLRLTDPLLPHLAQEFSVSLGEAAHVITFFSIAYGLSQLLFGPVGDRYGKYFVIACSSVACALSALLCALAPSFRLLLLARLLAGASAACVIPLSLAWIGDVVPYRDRQPVLARFLIGQILGVSAGALVGGLAADFDNWRLPFFGVASGFVGISLGLFSLNGRLPEHARSTHRAEGAVLRRTAAEFVQVLSRPWARVVLLAVFLEGGCLYGAFAFIASHLYLVHHLTLTAAGALVTLFGFGGLVFALLSARLVRGLGEVGLTSWGGVLIAASLAATGLSPVWWVAVPGCFGAGLGFYMLHNTLQINATQMAPERRGTAVSAFSSSFFLGQSAGVALAGTSVERFGTAPVIVAGGVGVLLVALHVSRRIRLRQAT